MLLNPKRATAFLPGNECKVHKRYSVYYTVCIVICTVEESEIVYMP